MRALGSRRSAVAARRPGRDKAANLIWSAKESALKVLETGLRRDTRRVEVTVPDLSSPERIWSRFRSAPRRCRLPRWWRHSGASLVTACWPAALDAESPIDTMAPSQR